MTDSCDLSPTERVRWSRTGLLAALALVLGYVDTFVPLPLPGVKLGLANIPVLVALSRGDAVAAACVSAIKVLATGLLFGSPLTIAYAAVGTLLSVSFMVPLSRLRTMRLWMVSTIGAMLHEVGQLLVATTLMKTTIVWHASPVLLAICCVTGMLTGVLAQRVAAAMPPDSEVCVSLPQLAPIRPPASALVAFCTLIVFVALTLRLEKLHALLICLAFALVACAASHVPVRLVVRAQLPLVSLVLVALIMEVWAHGISQLAIANTLRAALRLMAVAEASLAFMRLVPTDDLTGTMAWLVSPLSRLGIGTTGFLVAFHTAVQLVPALVHAASQRLGNHKGHLSARDLPQVLPDLIGSVLQSPEIRRETWTATGDECPAEANDHVSG